MSARQPAPADDTKSSGEPQLALPFRRSLLVKHAAFVAILVTVTAGALGHLAYVFARDMLRRDVHERLTLISEERSRLLETAMSVRLQQVALIATRSELGKLMHESLANRVDASQLESDVRSVLEAIHRTGEGFRQLSVAETTGAVVATAGEQQHRKTFAGDPLFASGLREAHIGLPQRDGDHYVLWAAAPLGVNDNKASAVLMVEFDVTRLVSEVLDSTGVGETGQVFIGWPSGDDVQFVAGSGADSSEKPLDPALAALLRSAADGQTRTGIATIADDEVVVSFRPIPLPANETTHCALLVLVDDLEAYAPVTQLRWNLLALQGLMLVVSVGAAIWVARRLTRPIIQLASTASSIAAGKLDRRAPVTSSDEVGLLAESFNRMTEQLVDSQEQLEQRVDERTAELIDSQKELNRKTRILRSVLDSMADGVVVADATGKFLVWNAAADRIIGIGPVDTEPGKWSEIYGCYLSDASTRCPPEDLPLARAIKGESIDDFDLFVRNPSVPNGVWISVNARPLKNSTGELRGGVAVFRDVSAAREASEAIQSRDDLNRAILATAHEAFIAIDRNSIIRQWNEQAVHTFGWKAEEAIGRKITDTIIPGRYSKAHLEGVDRFFATGEGPVLNRRIELIARHRDGHEFPVELTIAPVWQGNTYVFAAFVHDISEQRQARRDLELAREKAEAGSRAKSEFLANMSHEIRTPLNAIIGMTELVLDTKLSPTQRDYLDMVQESGESLLLVINDILDFSKIEAGRFELDHAPFDLREVLGDTMKTMAVRAHRKGLELAFHVKPSTPGILIGDRHRLRQVIVNLVGNAVKFTDEGEVVLDVSVAGPNSVPSDSVHSGAPPTVEADGDDGPASDADEGSSGQMVTLHFTVTDTGTGIPADKLDKIFLPFEQADESSTRRFAGTGLGLAICTRLVQMMNGRIWVESEEGHGSTFHFTAEFEAAGEVAEPARRDREAVLHDVRVLIVDDNRTNCRILDETLRNWGMQPAVARNGKEALAALRQARESGSPLDIVLVDGNMPGMDGFTLIERIREDAALREVGTILLTSSGARDTARSERLGIAACLTKPAKQSELFDAVCDCLGATRLPSGEAEREAAAVAAARIPPLVILLAEDNVVNQKLALGLLQPHGHRVLIAENGNKAVRAWESQHFDLILMDVQMPEMDGLEATRTIRRREPKGQHVPILAMTAHAIKGDRELCLEAGMDDYVSKPVRKRELYAAIERILPKVAAPAPSAAPAPLASSNGQALEGASTNGAPSRTDSSTPLVASETVERNGRSPVSHDGQAKEVQTPPDAFDWEEALSKSDLDETDFRELAGLFLTQCPELIAEIHQALEQKDFPRLRRAAHTLKGSEAIFIGHPSDLAAWKLESAARVEDLETAARTIPEVEREASRLVTALEEHIQ